ncbi:PQ-loop-domain-containing protein [Wilcoxina mikolae CBS 423.85]|nr:PQ-loop-domain-containing protein [Wilcoxina mikolae CBS 423.85]
MAAQTDIPTSATILGLIGTIFWCIQLVPQIWANFRSKNTEGLPASMMMLWAFSGIPFGVYAIIQNFNVPIQVQPQIFMTLSMISWGQCLHYSSSWRRLTSTLLSIILLLIFGAIEAVLIITLRPLYKNGKEYPMTIIGVIAAILLGAGLVPPYFEIAKRQGKVVGINFVFLAVDWAGAFFSLMSLVAQHTFDYLAGVMFIICLTLETGIFVSHLVWMFRFRGERRVEREREKAEEGTVEVKEDVASTAAVSAKEGVKEDTESSAAVSSPEEKTGGAA